MKNIMIILLGMVVLVGCQGKDGKVSASKISAEEALDMMSEEVITLDVRTVEEYGQGHIEGAQLLPLDTIQAGELGTIPDKDQVILIYCRSGNRSGQAAKILVDAGYTNIYDFGGINDWPYELVQ